MVRHINGLSAFGIPVETGTTPRLEKYYSIEVDFCQIPKGETQVKEKEKVVK